MLLNTTFFTKILNSEEAAKIASMLRKEGYRAYSCNNILTVEYHSSEDEERNQKFLKKLEEKVASGTKK